jgi:rod shape-determining protein MreC
MDTFLGRYKNLIVLAAVLFAQIVALAVQVRRPAQGGETRLIRLWAVSAVTPIEKAVVHSQIWMREAWNNYIYLRSVRRENRELRAQIERMNLEQARLSEDARMARRVQALLAFKEQYVDSTIAAQVIGTSGSEQSRVLYIDKGGNDGIKSDMAVITPAGIVGKIVQVFPDSAQVLPINDQFSGVGVLLKDSRLQGILRGASNGATTLQYIMADEKVVPGEDVITSGGDRIFPKGLPVGKVVAVGPGKDLFLNIRVVPSARLNQLEEVLVVTKVTEKMPDAKDLGPQRASDILAERLPTVPNKPQPDATSKTKPGAAAAGAAPAGTAPGSAARPNAPSPSLANQPLAGGTATRKPTPKPGSVPSAHPTPPPSANSMNGARTGTLPSPKSAITTPATAPPATNGAASENTGTESAPTTEPKQQEPAPQKPPATKPDQPVAPLPATEPPQP